MVTTRNSAKSQRATRSTGSQSGHTTPRSRREATGSSDRPTMITDLSDDDNDFQELMLPVRRRRLESKATTTTTSPVRSSKRLKQLHDQSAAEEDRKGKRRMTLPTPIVSSDDSTTSTPDFQDTAPDPLQEDDKSASFQPIKQEPVLTTHEQKSNMP